MTHVGNYNTNPYKILEKYVVFVRNDLLYGIKHILVMKVYRLKHNPDSTYLEIAYNATLTAYLNAFSIIVASLDQPGSIWQK